MQSTNAKGVQKKEKYVNGFTFLPVNFIPEILAKVYVVRC